MTVKELAENYGTYDLLIAYIMRTANVSEEVANEIIYEFDYATEMHLMEFLERWNE